ncbi:MAG TPA: TMEM175 family protein [Hyphomonadaceae bacterium]|nr:TMEM175 family protein [Hyphomonadaceae bacterium]
MTKGRLEAFSDGVIAIIITIMVLELKVPHEPTPEALFALWPIGLSYVLSFTFVGIYWNNHHHLFHAVHHISGGILWANLHLLFWLSLTPFVTGWMGENEFSKWPVFFYGVVLLCCALSFTILLRFLLAAQGPDSTLAKAIGHDWKGNVSILIYIAGLALDFIHPLLAVACYATVSVIWFIPDKRIERVLPEKR